MTHWRRLSWPFWGVAGALLMFAPVAHGQPKKAVQDSRVIVAKLWDCQVSKAAPKARALILGSLGYREQREQVAQLADGQCIIDIGYGGGTIAFPGDLALYGIAEALVRSDYSRPEELNFTGHPPLDHAMPDVSQRTSQWKMSEADFLKQRTASYVLDTWGECVVRRDTHNVHALLLTAPASAEERAALAALSPSFDACMQTGDVRLSLQVARGTLALNFYRLAGAPNGAKVAVLKVN